MRTQRDRDLSFATDTQKFRSMDDLLRMPGRRPPEWRTTLKGWLATPLRILSVCCYTYPAHWDSGRRCLAHVLLLVPMRQPLVIVEDGQRLRIEVGDAVAIRRGRRFRILVGSQRAEFVSLHLDALDDAQCSWFDGLPSALLAAAGHVALREALLDAGHLYWLDREEARALAQPIIRQLIAGWVGAGGRTGQVRTHPDPLVSDLVALARRRLAEGLSADDLRAASGLGETRFRQRFVAATGRAPVRFLAELRLRRAAELLHTTHLPVTEVAARSGFSDDRYLHACFHARFAQTPLAYRRAAAAGGMDAELPVLPAPPVLRQPRPRKSAGTPP